MLLLGYVFVDWFGFCFFFFKQKTAYEMRISDWSSDVCSSDLWWRTHRNPDVGHQHDAARRRNAGAPHHLPDRGSGRDPVGAGQAARCALRSDHDQARERVDLDHARSEERRAGNEFVSPCSSRWWHLHETKYNTIDKMTPT